METIIKVNPSELNENLLDKIKKFIGGKDVDVTISLREFDREYANALERSIDEAEKNKELVTFTMNDFVDYTPSVK